MSIIDYFPDIYTELIKYFTFKGKLKLRLICKKLYDTVFIHFHNNNPKIGRMINTSDISTYPLAIFTNCYYPINELSRFCDNQKCIESNKFFISKGKEREFDINNVNQSIRKLCLCDIKKSYIPNIIVLHVTKLYITGPYNKGDVLPKSFLEYFPNLTTLLLGDYTLENPIPLLPKLEKIFFYRIKSEHEISHLITIKKVCFINVGDAILKSIKKLINIEKLYIMSMFIKDLNISKLTKLTWLALYDVPDVTNDFFMHNTTIKTLKITSCDLLSDECLTNLINCTHLTLSNLKYKWYLNSLKNLYQLNIKSLFGTNMERQNVFSLLSALLYKIPNLKVIKTIDNDDNIISQILQQFLPKNVIIRWNSESIHDAIYHGLPKNAIY